MTGAFNGDMDDETASLLDLQLQDSRDLFKTTPVKGNTSGTGLSEFRLALQLNQEKLEKAATVLSNRQMTRSISQAVRADTELLAASI